MARDRERRDKEPRGKAGRWAEARRLVVAIGLLAERRDAGVIDEAAYRAEVQALAEAAPGGVVRLARRIAAAARTALRPAAAGGDADDPAAG